MAEWGAHGAAGAAAGGQQHDHKPHLSLRSVNHISHVCSDVERTAAFYRLLGFLPVKRPQSLDAVVDGCWLWRYGLGLHLIKGTPVPRSTQIDPTSDHLSFQADSLDQVAAQLEAAGVPFVRQAVCEGGQTVGQLFFKDPDLNMIEVCNCETLPLVPLDAGLSRCHTCAAEVARLREENGGGAAALGAVDEEVMAEACKAACHACCTADEPCSAREHGGAGGSARASMESARSGWAGQ